MIYADIHQTTEHVSLRNAVAMKDAVEVDSVFLFEDVTLFLEELLKDSHASLRRLIALSPCRAEIAMAADRAEIELVQVDRDELSETVAVSDFIILANPNRTNGDSLSLSELEELAEKVSQGLLIVDEFYFDFLKITAAQALKEHNNIVVLRFFNNWQMAGTRDSGYALFSTALSITLGSEFYRSSMTRSTAWSCYEQFGRNREKNTQLQKIQTKSLQTARELTELGLKCRLTPTDFLLVDAPSAEVAAELHNKNQLNIETIYNHNRISNQLRCRITLSTADEELIETFRQAFPAKSNILGSKTPKHNSISPAATVGLGEADR